MVYRSPISWCMCTQRLSEAVGTQILDQFASSKHSHKMLIPVSVATICMLRMVEQEAGLALSLSPARTVKHANVSNEVYEQFRVLTPASQRQHSTTGADNA